MAIASSKTREMYPLSTKKVLKKTFTGTIIWCILFLILYGISVFIFALFQSPFGWLISGIVIVVLLSVIIILTYLYQLWYYNVYFYDLTADYIVIRKGPITPREITIPYERVQDVYVDQDILDRLFGLYDVHLSSATVSSGMEAHIDGVEKSAADGLREVLLQTISKKISKNQTPSASPPIQTIIAPPSPSQNQPGTYPQPQIKR